MQIESEAGVLRGGAAAGQSHYPCCKHEAVSVRDDSGRCVEDVEDSEDELLGGCR